METLEAEVSDSIIPRENQGIMKSAYNKTIDRTLRILNEKRLAKGVRKILKAKRKDHKKWNEIYENLQWVDVENPERASYLVNLGKIESVPYLAAVGMISGGLLGLLSSGYTETHLGPTSSLFIAYGIGVLGTATGFVADIARVKSVSRPYGKLKKEAEKNKETYKRRKEEKELIRKLESREISLYQI